MKVNKINKVLEKYTDDKYPFKIKFKNRIPDPGICHVISIDFEDE